MDVAVSMTKSPQGEINEAGNHADAEPRSTLQRVFQESAEALYRFILVRTGGDRTAADDLLQQTCCIAAGHRKTPVEPDQCEAWLRGIARNLVREFWKSSAKQARLLDPEFARNLVEDMETGPLPTDRLQGRESREQLLLAVTELPATDQQLIFAFYFQGRSQTELAEDWATSSKSIESKLYRARTRLRDILRNPKG